MLNRFVNKLKTYYSFGILVGFIIFIAVPMGWYYSMRQNKEGRTLFRFHKRKARFFRRYMKHYLCGVSTEVLNASGEDFKKPALIIANHQSLLDLPATLMLHPRIVAMTGQWVWDSKLYGKAIRYSEFFPAMMPMDEMLQHIQQVMAKGYSVLIFPEGTRSEDCQVHTFRRGAFHLAEQLKCDVVPVTLWGTGRCLPKDDFCLRSGHIVVDIGKRIRFVDGIMGEAHGPMTRYWHRYFIQRYAQLQEQYEV